MLEIKENNLKTGGILIGSDIVARTSNNSGFGIEDNNGNVDIEITMIFFSKELFEKEGFNAPIIAVDGVAPISEKVKGDQDMSYKAINEIGKKYLVDKLKINPEDIIIK